MAKQRTAYRWRLLLTLAVGTFVALASFWLLEVMRRDDPKLGGGDLSEPDYIVEKFSFVRMTPEGKPRYLFYGAKLTHHPLDDVSEVERPIMQNMTPGAPPMTINAQRARIMHQQQNQVDLLGKVDIVRPASPQAQYMRLKTEALTVFPEEDRMRSSRNVQMVLGAATINGTGMEANNATAQVGFKGRGQVIFPPRAARAAP